MNIHLKRERKRLKRLSIIRGRLIFFGHKSLPAEIIKKEVLDHARMVSSTSHPNIPSVDLPYKRPGKLEKIKSLFKKMSVKAREILS